MKKYEIDLRLGDKLTDKSSVAYNTPDVEVISLLDSDIITNSGTETTQVENTDGIWDLNQNA